VPVNSGDDFINDSLTIILWYGSSHKVHFTSLICVYNLPGVYSL